jgi:FixJ family two-component response regulator
MLLPAALGRMPASRSSVRSGTATTAQPAKSPPDSWVGVVDDDASLRSALARALRGSGIRVEVFASAEEFLERRPRGEVNCLVLDIHLGGVTGFDLRDHLMAAGTMPPIIFITGHDDAFAERARAGGACGCLRKPFDVCELLDLVEPHLRSSP